MNFSPESEHSIGEHPESVGNFRTFIIFYVALFADIVAEVTQPSLGVGYEIGRGVEMGKKILCLFRPQSDKSK